VSRFSRRSGLFAIGLLAATLSPVARADTLVIPAAFENADADSNLSFPFAQVTLPPSNYPYQYEQVYGVAEFGTPADALYITAARFRVDQPTGDRGPFQIEHLELRVGTSTKGPDQLTSLQGGSNIDGGDTTLVFSGPLSFDPCDADVCALPAFDIEVAFTAPFVYDPSSGRNLVLNFLNTSDTQNFPNQLFDAAQDTDGTSSVREVLQRDDPATHLFLAPATVGLVTQFVFTVPEADSTLAGAAALGAVAILRRRRVR